MNKQLLAGAVMLMFTLPVMAQSHDHSAKHGGIIVESGHHHLEVELKDGTIEVHVTGEDGGAEDIAGAKASATILSGGKTETITLTADGEALKGTGSFTAGKGTVAVITLSMPDHPTEQARVQID